MSRFTLSKQMEPYQSIGLAFIEHLSMLPCVDYHLLREMRDETLRRLAHAERYFQLRSQCFPGLRSDYLERQGRYELQRTFDFIREELCNPENGVYFDEELPETELPDIQHDIEQSIKEASWRYKVRQVIGSPCLV